MTTCKYCGATHEGVCPRISRIEFPPGQEDAWTAVEFHRPEPLTMSMEDGDESMSVSGSYEDVARWRSMEEAKQTTSFYSHASIDIPGYYDQIANVFVTCTECLGGKTCAASKLCARTKQ